jgi:hypothetical protein
MSWGSRHCGIAHRPSAAVKEFDERNFLARWPLWTDRINNTKLLPRVWKSRYPLPPARRIWEASAPGIPLVYVQLPKFEPITTLPLISYP